MNPPLYAPWRMEYLRSLDKSSEECFLCRAAAASDPTTRRQRLLLWSTDLSIVVINRYPYANGHLLIAPREHKQELEELSEPQQIDLFRQTTLAVRVLKQAVSARDSILASTWAGLPARVCLGMSISTSCRAGVVTPISSTSSVKRTSSPRR